MERVYLPESNYDIDADDAKTMAFLYERMAGTGLLQPLQRIVLEYIPRWIWVRTKHIVSPTTSVIQWIGQFSMGEALIEPTRFPRTTNETAFYLQLINRMNVMSWYSSSPPGSVAMDHKQVEVDPNDPF